MKSVYVHGSYFGNNFGDVLLVDLFANRIRNMGYIPIFPFANDFYRQQTGTEIGIKDYNNAVAAIYCGGGYLGEPNSGKLIWSIRNFFRHHKSFRFFKNNNIPYAVVGAGCGPVTYFPFSITVKNIISKAEFVVLRDEKSKSFAQLYSGRYDIDVAADAVISMTLNDIPDESKLKATSFFNKNTPKGSHLVGIHLTDKFKDPGKFELIVEAVSKLSLDYPELFFVFLSDGKSRRGKKLKQIIDSEYISSRLGGGRFTFYDYSNHWDMAATLSGFDVVLTSKLHVGVVSTALGVNVVSIPYHSKTIRYYEQVNARERCLTSFDSVMQIYKHIETYLWSSPIEVPAEVISSSESLFESISDFLVKLDV